MRDAVIAGICRTAVGKAPRGGLKDVRPDDLAALCFVEAVRRVPGLDGARVEEVILGCAYPEGPQGTNVARIAALRAGFPVSVAAMTVNRFCASGLEAIALACQRIESGNAEIIVAGGMESMSMIPRGGYRPSPNPSLTETYPDVYLNMGLTAERIQKKYGISRVEQDEFSRESHAKAAAAQKAGRFREEIVPVPVTVQTLNSGKLVEKVVPFLNDDGVRAETSVEGLAKLPPAFLMGGTVTAGNSSQTSDGAAAAVVMTREMANRMGIKPLGRLISYAVGGCPPEIMGMGPVHAVPKALQRAKVSLDEIDLIELNEAFAVQALAVARELNLPADKLNVNGGAVALGHPLGATGAKLVATLLHELPRRGGRRGLVTMCVGGGMGAAGVFETCES
ncbi:MAG: thiolase family protein [Planctomycetota bacterium]